MNNLLLKIVFLFLLLSPFVGSKEGYSQLNTTIAHNNEAFKCKLKGPVKNQTLTVTILKGVPDLKIRDTESYVLKENYNNQQIRTIEWLYNLKDVLIAKSEILYDQNGFATEVIYTDLFENMLNRVTYAYNDTHNWKQVVNYDAYYNPIGIYDYRYTSKGFVSEIAKKNEEGYVLQRDIYVYNDQGLLVEQIRLERGKQTEHTDYLYNRMKKLISYRIVSNGDSLKTYLEANYANDTILTNVLVENYQNGNPNQAIKYRYDPLGNILQTIEYNVQNKKDSILTDYIYEWDLWGNWTKQLIQRKDSVEIAASRDIIYFEDKALENK